MVATTSLVVSIAMFAVASPALAVTHHPKGEFAPFAECPTENAEVEDCVVAKTESGEFTLGKERVPITNPIILQGGLNHLFSGVEQFFAAENGNTLTKSPQKVPGGLLGLVKCNEISNFFERVACEVIFENGVTGVNATTELAAPASSVGVNTINLISQTGTALSLPLKVHLENPLLGSGCYIGSNAHPIVIEFTSGTTSPPGPNKPITGKPGEIKTNESGTILSNTGNELVNNSYPAPAAEGCGGIFSFLIDPLIDSKLSLPSAAGHNTAILRGTLLVTTPGLVKEHE
ncbi:MAG TPA: hypothetical protein VK272_13485 [Solirubrobacteraceae bacterium]|nr:hypothetical protein [Solirubrobacteraceae bacterium]